MAERAMTKRLRADPGCGRIGNIAPVGQRHGPHSRVEAHSMRAPSTRTRKILLGSSGPVAVLFAGLMVWQGSEAAFTAETYNAGNNWQAGSVTLSNDGTGRSEEH